MEKQIFKKGDKVFDYLFGWGNVVEVRDDNNRFPLRVQFKKGIAGYTFDGRFYEDSPQTLSFTEYTLNGFSQERPVELPEIGEEIMVSEDGYNWYLLAFSEFRKGCVYSKTGIAYKHFKRLRENS